MDLSPNDIRNFEFHSQMRGYDKDEVDSLLDQVSATLEEKSQQILKLKMEMESVSGQLAGLKQFEDTIKGAAIDARRNADMTIATAKQEAAMLMSTAKAECQELMVTRTKEVSEIESQITKLGMTKKAYLSKVRSLIESHLEMVDHLDEDPRPEVKDTLEVTDSADVTIETRETVAQPETNEPYQIDHGDEDHDMVDDGTRTDLEESVPATKDDQPNEDEAAPIDPELAAALENYQTGPQATGPQVITPENIPVPEPTACAPQSMVETNALAEDVPEGFITKDDGAGQKSSTGRIAVDPQASNADETDQDKDPLDPSVVVENLDEVATKFEEAMDRAQKT